MDFTIVGAGALGTILAAHLARDGHRVICLLRNPRAQQVQHDGLRVTGLAEINVPCEVITDPSAVANTDVLVIGTKTYQTEAAIKPLDHVKAKAIFSMANGVKKNEQLNAVFDPASVLGCMANISGELLDDGVVNYTRNVCLHLGPLQTSQQSTAREVAQAINATGIVCHARDDIQTIEWSKYVGWVAFMCLAVISRARTIDFLLNENHARVAVRLIKEMANIAAAKQISLVDQSPMPVKTIAENDEAAAIQAVIDMGKEFAATAPNHRMSSLQDLERGAVLEHEDTLGYALELARAEQLPAPTIEDCYDLVAGINAINRRR